MTIAPTYLTPAQVAERFGIKENTLAAWRMRKTGIPYLKIGSIVKYKLEDVEKYEKENMHNVGVKPCMNQDLK